MVTISDNLIEAEQRLAAAKVAYDAALQAAASQFDEGGASTRIQRQELSVVEKALLRARAEVKYFKGNNGVPSNAPMYLGHHLR